MPFYLEKAPVPFNPTRNLNKKLNPVKKPKTQRKRQSKPKKTQHKVRINLKQNDVTKYYCPDMKSKKEQILENNEPMEGEFKPTNVPYISLKELFD